MTHHTHEQHEMHQEHSHEHDDGCGHRRVAHNGHHDFLHRGHLHHPHQDHVDEHELPVGDANPVECTPQHGCQAHKAGHGHGADCGHEPVPHGGHVDYLVGGHLHFPHDDHCDTHREIQLA